MTTTIWARRSSSCAQKVFWGLAEIGAPHRQVDAGRSFGVVHDPNYLAKNPNGLVPTLEEDDGFVLWESHAILRYLAAKHEDETLWPSDLRRRAAIDRWMDWTITTAVPAINPIFGRLVMHRDEPVEPGFVDRQIEMSSRALTIAASVLKDRPFLEGEDLTLADIPFGMIINRWFNLPIQRPDFPVISRYYERLRERPAYVTHVVDAPPVV